MARSVKELAVRLTTDVTDFARGTQDAADDTSDLARSVDTDTEKIARSFNEMTRDAGRSLDKLQADSKKGFHKLSDDAAHEMSSGPAKESFKEAGSEVGAEFASNLGESLASGDLTSTAKDTAGGLVSAFAGIGGGIGVGLAGAAAVATAVFAKMQAEAEARARRISDITGTIFDRMSEDIQTALTESIKGEAFNNFAAAFGKDLPDGLRKMRDLAQKAGISVGEIANAFINGGPAADALKAKLAQAVQSGTRLQATGKATVTTLSDSAVAAQKLAGRMGEAETASKNAADANQISLEVLLGAAQAAGDMARNLQRSAQQSKLIEQRIASAGGSMGGKLLRP